MYCIAPPWALMYDIISLLHDACMEQCLLLGLICIILGERLKEGG